MSPGFKYPVLIIVSGILYLVTKVGGKIIEGTSLKPLLIIVLVSKDSPLLVL